MTPEQEPPVEEISLEDYASGNRIRAERLEVVQFEAGMKLLRWMMLLIAFALLLITVFAWLSYPGKDATEVEHATWFSEVKDLLQLLVVSLLVPLLATMIGYLFGRGADSGGHS